MTGSFTVGALAVKSEQATSVGAVRFTVLPDRLEIELVRAGQLRESFIPGVLTEAVRFSVPYTAVRGMVRRGEILALSLDPQIGSPHTRFALTHFTDLPIDALILAHKRRATAQLLERVVPVPIGVAAYILVPAEMASGGLGRTAVAVGAGVLSAVILHGWTRIRTWGGPLSDRLCEAFEQRLSQRLAIMPTVTIETGPFEKVSQELIDRPVTALQKLARRRLLRPLAFAFLAIFLGVGAVAGYRAIDRMNNDAPGTIAAGGLSSATNLDAFAPAPPPELPSCTCPRADSPLWSSGMPALAMIPISKLKTEDGRPESSLGPVMKKGVPRFDFDVAIANDSATSLKDIRVVLTFARRNKQGARVNATDRGLFWGGELGPGSSAKWNVAAPGSEVRIDLEEKRLLGDGPGQLRPARAEAFLKLLTAKPIQLKLHAVVMLAYLHDARAISTAQTVGELSDADETVRRMAVRAAAPTYACDVHYAADKVTACAVNDGDTATPLLDLAEVGPGGAAGRRSSLPQPIAPHRGVRIEVPWTGAPAEEVMLVHGERRGQSREE